MGRVPMPSAGYSMPGNVEGPVSPGPVQHRLPQKCQNCASSGTVRGVRGVPGGGTGWWGTGWWYTVVGYPVVGTPCSVVPGGGYTLYLPWRRPGASVGTLSRVPGPGLGCVCDAESPLKWLGFILAPHPTREQARVWDVRLRRVGDIFWASPASVGPCRALAGLPCRHTREVTAVSEVVFAAALNPVNKLQNYDVKLT